METYLHVMLIRFAVIAAVLAAVGVALFAVAVALKKRGRWDQARERYAPMVTRAVGSYLESRRRR